MCACVCVGVRVYVCRCRSMCVCVYACVSVWVCECVSRCLSVYLYACLRGSAGGHVACGMFVQPTQATKRKLESSSTPAIEETASAEASRQPVTSSQTADAENDVDA
jgi:hypothetical protein